MSIVAISQTLGSLGDQVGRRLAQLLAYDFADREIILRAAERFGGTATELHHVTDERPTLWERFTHTERVYRTWVEAIIWELAARDRVVLVGRGSAFVLKGVRHALRVRVTAPESVRAVRVREQEGLPTDLGLNRVREDARERAARIRFLYGVDWDDPLLYDLVLNTDRLGVEGAARVAREALGQEPFQPTEESLAAVRDRSIVALARAALLASPVTRSLDLHVDCRGGHLTLTGTVRDEAQRKLAEEIVEKIPGVRRTLNEIAVVPARSVPPGI